MAATQRKVLVIDLDPQGNATMASGVDKYQVDATAYDLLVEETPFEEVVVKSTSGGYDLISANGDVTAAEIKLMEVFAREVRLRTALSSVREKYDFIFIDCPPALNLLTINAMAASDSVLVPMQCEYFALEGLTALMDTISKLAAVVNADLKIEGLLRTMFDPRNRLSNEVSDQLKKHFGDKVYRTVIPRNVRLAEAPSHGLPAMYYDKYSAGAKAYLALAGEIIRRSEVDNHVSSEKIEA
jgi:chromosome partitioning protein